MFRVLFFEVLRKHTGGGTETKCKGRLCIMADPVIDMVGGDAAITMQCSYGDYERVVSNMANYSRTKPGAVHLFVTSCIVTTHNIWTFSLSTEPVDGVTSFSWEFDVDRDSGGTVLLQAFLLAQLPSPSEKKDV